MKPSIAKRPTTGSRYVTETEMRQEKYLVQRPVVETQMREQQYTVQRAVQETVMQQQAYTAYQPVQNYANAVRRSGAISSRRISPYEPVTRNRLWCVPGAVSSIR